MRLAMLLCVGLVGCGHDDPGKLIEPPCAAPPGFVIRYNVATQHYSWCFAAGYCPSKVFSSRTAALASAQRQYEYGLQPHPKVYDPDEDEDNWKRIENPCDKENLK